jgi:3-methylcrotonyl-CoA carboxylase alpha subunit
MFGKILVANRGEIACRVIRTARRLGVRTVAVYSEADAGALHVAMADEAYAIGPAPARESYLNGQVIVAAARRSGAQAIHPGYGFLSENATFAKACADAGIVFIGPPPAAIAAMGDKSAAKALMEKSGVPVVPGYHGDKHDAATLRKAAAKIGYPVLIKASAGGGGKGMRIVEAEGALAEAVASASREAEAAFGDGRLLVEKYLLRPRHVEVQVFADSHGNAVHLFERDCSIQRRYQKVLEEAPAPGLSDPQRGEIGAAAVRAAQAVGYVGAGTVEFILDGDGRFYFMEMNTRLQVEHPVTEMITGQDLVEWQLRVASGERLPLAQEELRARGHAIEVRIYAEDPHKDFLPAIGRLAHLRFPSADGHVRVDTGVREGDSVTPYYDPMIAKLIVWDADRAAAVRRLSGALAQCEIAGCNNNVDFLAALAAHPAFAAAQVDTGFIARHRADLVHAPEPASDRVLALAALGELLARRRDAEAATSADPYSPWNLVSGWRLNGDSFHVVPLRDGDRGVAVTAHFRGRGFALDLPGGAMAAQGELEGGRLTAELGGDRLSAGFVRLGDDITIFLNGRSHRLTLVDPLASAGAVEVADGRLAAPMPGRIVAVRVAAGEKVKRGAPLVVLEAMKMEHTIVAPADGTVEEVRCAAGEQVAEGARLVEFKADA